MMVQPAEAYVQKDSTTSLGCFLKGSELVDSCLSRLTEIDLQLTIKLTGNG